jgi:hypothetical protein
MRLLGFLVLGGIFTFYWETFFYLGWMVLVGWGGLGWYCVEHSVDWGIRFLWFLFLGMLVYFFCENKGYLTEE